MRIPLDTSSSTSLVTALGDLKSVLTGKVTVENDTAILEGTTVKLKQEAADLPNRTFGVDALAGGFVIGVAKITVNTAAKPTSPPRRARPAVASVPTARRLDASPAAAMMGLVVRRTLSSAAIDGA